MLPLKKVLIYSSCSRVILEEFDFQVRKSTDKEWRDEGDGEKLRNVHGISSGSTIISVLPGSRLQEVTRMLPIFSHTLELLKNDFSELTAVIYVAPNKQVEGYIRKAVGVWPVPVVMVPGVASCIKYNAFSASRVALCASGTAAVELQLARLPCVVAYRAHVLTGWFIRYKAKIPYISRPKIILNSALVPEALFEACTPSHMFFTQ
ncbi:probable lipid-A-disaccharide synthase, mitochondrial [Primulina huaijiensis]|uniref:probable lipid-A-disaccharide synthase, mitochondrial n=1 Tax=Primulina huaijiensis TaxID=1492673 RepID=UPI003CC73660